VPEIVLQRAGIAPIVGELVTTAMPQLMRMDEPRNPSRLADPRQCFADAGFNYRGLAFLWTTWCRLVVAAAAVATTHTSSPASGWRDGTLTRGCRHLMGRNEGVTDSQPDRGCTVQHSNPPAAFYWGRAGAFLSSGYGVPADGAA
jgi:hypothetical protein